MKDLDLYKLTNSSLSL